MQSVGGVSPNLLRVLARLSPDLVTELFAAGKVLDAEVISVFQDRAMLSFGKGVRLEVALQSALKEGQQVRLQVQPKEPGGSLVLKLVQPPAPQAAAQPAPPTAVRVLPQPSAQPQAPPQHQPQAEAQGQPQAPVQQGPRAQPLPQAEVAPQAQAPQQAAAPRSHADPQAPPAARLAAADTGQAGRQDATQPPHSANQLGPARPTPPGSPAPAGAGAGNTPATAGAPEAPPQAPAGLRQTAALAVSTQGQPPPAGPIESNHRPTQGPDRAPDRAPAETGEPVVRSSASPVVTAREVALARAEAPPAPADAQPGTQAAAQPGTQADAQPGTQAAIRQDSAAPTQVQPRLEVQSPQAPLAQVRAEAGQPPLIWIPVPLENGRQGWAQLQIQQGDTAGGPADRIQHQVRLWWETPHVGQVQVTLDASGESLTALFTILLAQVRQGLERGLPDLQTRLAAAGFGDVKVGYRQALPGEPLGPVVATDSNSRLDRRL